MRRGWRLIPASLMLSNAASSCVVRGCSRVSRSALSRVSCPSTPSAAVRFAGGAAGALLVCARRCGTAMLSGQGGSRRSPLARRGGLGAVRSARQGRSLWCGLVSRHPAAVHCLWRHLRRQPSARSDSANARATSKATRRSRPCTSGHCPTGNGRPSVRAFAAARSSASTIE